MLFSKLQSSFASTRNFCNLKQLAIYMTISESHFNAGAIYTVQPVNPITYAVTALKRSLFM